MKIEEMDFSVRTYHALKRAGINTCEEIQRMDDSDLFNLRHVGKTAVSEIRAKLPYIPPEKIVPQPVTNADRIRAMTDEELAAITMCPNTFGAGIDCFGAGSCVECCTKWLKQPAEVEP